MSLKIKKLIDPREKQIMNQNVVAYVKPKRSCKRCHERGYSAYQPQTPEQKEKGERTPIWCRCIRKRVDQMLDEKGIDHKIHVTPVIVPTNDFERLHFPDAMKPETEKEETHEENDDHTSCSDDACSTPEG